MSLLGKLFGDGKNEVLGALKEAAQKAGVDSLMSSVQAAQEARASAPQTARRQESWESRPKSGFSWGDEMPKEENQFNFDGHYLQYFDKVFSEAFPQMRITRETLPTTKRATAYYFWQGDRKALVAELMSENSESNKLRTSCRAQGIPYVRFYYDHYGWWNTRAYVVARTHAALGY
jgi:hypothetical protein